MSRFCVWKGSCRVSFPEIRQYNEMVAQLHYIFDGTKRFELQITVSVTISIQEDYFEWI